MTKVEDKLDINRESTPTTNSEISSGMNDEK